MKLKDSLTWFKTTFQPKLLHAVNGTPFSVDLLTAIAQQETGYIWAPLVKDLSLAEILQLCTSDVIDAKYQNGRNIGRSAFPKNKAELLSHPKGEEMFRIARAALVDMAEHVPGFKNSVAIATKFCRGFGIFQYDLQFFRTDPDYFLTRKWHDFDECLSRLINELKAAQKRQGWQSKNSLTTAEQVHVAIAYNRGKSVLSKGFQQGHKPKNGRYYGENIYEYLLLSQSIHVSSDHPAATTPSAPDSGQAVLPPPAEPATDGQFYLVDVSSVLRLRRQPTTDSEVLTVLPAGQIVRRVDGRKPAEWFEVESILHSALHRGFVASQWLKKTRAPDTTYFPPAPSSTVLSTPSVFTNTAPPRVPPSTASAWQGPPAVYAPRTPGSITRRQEGAGARSLNEPNQPQRTGENASDRVLSLHSIMDWLDVANPNHLRYKPANAKTYCNIYAHDYCHLVNVYLPRVWWRGAALIRMARGETVEPLLGNTIDEQRANDLFRWLQEFGESFGWVGTASLTDLQNAANLGAVCPIIARRKVEGASGHVAMVVPEYDGVNATRSSTGEVTNPVQSQAGSTNFKRRKGIKDWYKADRFAEHAFWFHA